MRKKILIAKLITFIGTAIGALSIALLKGFSWVPPVFYITFGVVLIIASLVIGYFLGRCPDCHMPLHLKDSSLFEYCPYCGKRL